MNIATCLSKSIKFTSLLLIIAVSFAAGFVLPNIHKADASTTSFQMVNAQAAGSAKIGIWYYSWQCSFNNPPIYNITKILAGQGDWGPLPAFHWVDEPQAGYYCLSTNDALALQQGQELANAGIDFVMWDVTNWAYTDASGKTAVMDPMTNVLRIWSTIPNAPKIVPVLELPADATMPQFVTSLLANYPNMELIYQGKPLVLVMDNPSMFDQNRYNQLSVNYTVRKMGPASQQDGEWSYIQPCTAGFKETSGATSCNQFINRTNGQQEFISVNTAYQTTYMSNTTTAVPRLDGTTFVKQFQAVFNNPNVPFVGILGWNQWAAQRFCFNSQGVIPQDLSTCVTDTLPNGNKIFVDSYNYEYSSDMEPVQNPSGDFYYQLLKSCIAKYHSGLAGCDTNVAYTPGVTNTVTNGYLDGIQGDKLFGWTYDPDAPSAPIAVHFYIDGSAGIGTFAGATATDVLRSDVNQALGITGNHGFAFTIPPQYQDGKTHQIYAYGIDTTDTTGYSNSLLHSSPLSFTINPPVSQPTATIAVNPSSITAGGSSILSWSTTNATTVSISGIGSVAASGSQSVSPTQTTTYTITATNSAGSKTATVTLTVNLVVNKPTVTFTVSPQTITSGNSAVLTWSTNGASSVSIDNGIGSVPVSGNQSVNPTQTTTYTITATNSAGSSTAQVTVSVNAPPALPTATISVSPITITSGSSAMLAWSTTNATSVSISGLGSVGSSGSQSVSPTQTTTYTITATNSAGSKTATATLTVNPIISKPGVTFGVSPQTITTGKSASLSWSVTGATSIIIDNGIGSVSASGSQSVSPTQTTTYTITATNSAGSTIAQVTVSVNMPPATPTASISASPQVITSGSSTTLTWSTSNASSVSISGMGSVGSSGSKTVAPTQTTTYVVTASNAAGSVTDRVTVTVNPVDSHLPVISISANPSVIMSGASSTLIWNVTDADTVILSGFGFVPSSGLQVVTPTQTTTYTLTAANSNGSTKAIVTVTVNSQPPSAQVYPDGTLLKDGAAIYIIEYGAKRPFVSMAVFNGLGFQMANVKTANTSGISMGGGIFTAAQRHTRGTLINSNGTIYFVGADLRYAFPSAEVFLSWGNRFQDIVPANSYDLRLPQGPIVQHK